MIGNPRISAETAKRQMKLNRRSEVESEQVAISVMPSLPVMAHPISNNFQGMILIHK
jgi:hypothetical protein